MARDYLEEPINAVRRRDRAVEDEAWIRALLQRAPMGALATVCDGRPFINTNTFAFDEQRHAIYMHTARVGRTRANLEAHEQVCFSVSEMGRLLPSTTAKSMSVEYAGVLVFGQGAVVEEPAEARHGLQLLLDKYFPHLLPERDYRPITDEEQAQTAVYRISIECWSGKQKVADPEFPGAFWYAEVMKPA